MLQVPTAFWVYIGCMFVLSVVGTVFQYKNKPEKDEDVEELGRSFVGESEEYFSVDEESRK